MVLQRLVRKRRAKDLTYGRRFYSLTSHEQVYNRQLRNAMVLLALKIKILRRCKESDDTKSRIYYLLRTLTILSAKYISINYKFIDDKPLKVNMHENDEEMEINGIDLDHFDETDCTINFGFIKEDLRRIIDAIRVPHTIWNGFSEMD